MTEKQYETLIKKYGVKLVDEKIQAFEASSQRKKGADHYLSINNWCRKDQGTNGCKADDDYFLFNPDKKSKGDGTW